MLLEKIRARVWRIRLATPTLSIRGTSHKAAVNFDSVAVFLTVLALLLY